MLRTRNDVHVTDNLFIGDISFIKYNKSLEEMHFGIKDDIVFTVSASSSSLVVTEHLYSSHEDIDENNDVGTLMMASFDNKAYFVKADEFGSLNVNIQSSLFSYNSNETDYASGVLMLAEREGITNDLQYLQLDENNNLKCTIDNILLDEEFYFMDEEIETTNKGFLMMGESTDGITTVAKRIKLDTNGYLLCNVQNEALKIDSRSTTQTDKGLLVLGKYSDSVTEEYTSFNIDQNGRLNCNAKLDIQIPVNNDDTTNKNGIIMLGNDSSQSVQRSIALNSEGKVYTTPKGSYDKDQIIINDNGGLLVYGYKTDTNTVTPVNLNQNNEIKCSISDTTYSSGQDASSGTLMMGEHDSKAYNVALDSSNNMKVTLSNEIIEGMSNVNGSGMFVFGVDNNNNASFIHIDDNNNIKTNVETASFVFAEGDIVGSNKNDAVLLSGVNRTLGKAQNLSCDDYGILGINSAYFSPKNYHMVESTIQIKNNDSKINLIDTTSQVETITWPADANSYKFSMCFLKEITIICEIDSTSIAWDKMGTSSVVLGSTPEFIISVQNASSISQDYASTLTTNSHIFSYFNSNQTVQSFGNLTTMTLIGTKKFPYVLMNPGTTGLEIGLKYLLQNHGFKTLTMNVTVSFDASSS